MISIGPPAAGWGRRLRWLPFAAALTLLAACATTPRSYDNTLEVFRQAGESAQYFNTAYGYALFPTIGKAGFIIGGARGKGQVYELGRYIGNTTVTQLTAGLQAGGQAYSQIIFFRDQRALEEFTSGNFEFGLQTTAVAVTAGANAAATTTGVRAGVSGGRHDASTLGGYHKGTAVFIVAKGGLMLEASVGGQRFTFTPASRPREPVEYRSESSSWDLDDPATTTSPASEDDER